MKSLWVHGTYFIEFEGDYYHHNLTLQVWEERYLNYFDNIVVCSRVKKAQSKEEILGKHLSIPKDDKRISFHKLNLGFFPNQKQLNDINSLVGNFDAVIARLPSGNAYKVVDMAIKNHKKCIVEVVGCVWDALTTHSLRGKIIAPYSTIKMKRAVKKANFALYVTRDFLQNRYHCNGTTCSCSDIDITYPSQEVMNSRIELCRSFDKTKTINLATIGAVDVKYKGQEYVIKAISKLKKQGYKFKYVLVGGGNNERLLSLARKLGVEDEVVFTGNLKHEKVFEVLDSTHIYVHPSLTEGLPRSVLEAKSRGCAVICSNVGGIPEIVDKGSLFNKKDVRAIINLLVAYTPNKLESEAKVNIEFAEQFALNNSDEVRNEFMEKIIKS